jgi:hyaluronoglucosaminidase
VRITTLAAASLLAISALTYPVAATAADPPAVWPAPQQIQRLGADVTLPAEVLVVADAGADQPTRQAVVEALRDGGATNVTVVEYGQEHPAPLVVRVGALSGPNIRSAGVQVPDSLPAEGYFLSATNGLLLLGGQDGDGSYHAAQTLWQLMQPGKIPSVRISDFPSMRVRGVVYGPYGPPWTHPEELDQIQFYGRVKFNSFIYAPKNDPYHRVNWRSLYPAGRRAELAELVTNAAQHHVTFTYALAPGLSICYSSASDWTALTNKFRSLYDIGVRSFSLPLDDIDYDKWNCDADRQRYGAPGPRNAAQAQVDLLNRLQREFLPTLAGAKPLQTVPTEYWDTDDSPYKSTIRQQLDSRVVMMWTGVGVTPTSIEVFEAANAEQVWGRKPLVWDNYPVSDYPEATGRLLLAPYAERKAGIGAHLIGITANPMTLAYASKPAVFGAADFSWNETAYDPARNTRQYVDWLSGGDPAQSAALSAFFDLNHLAPVTGEDTIWQPQAPELARRIAVFKNAFANGDKHAAIDALWDYSEIIRTAPAAIRAGTADPGFASDADPWLGATELWADALQSSLVGLAARVDGDEGTAQWHFDDANTIRGQAEAIQVPPGVTELTGPVKIGDGVLDSLLDDIPEMHP